MTPAAGGRLVRRARPFIVGWAGWEGAEHASVGGLTASAASAVGGGWHGGGRTWRWQQPGVRGEPEPGPHDPETDHGSNVRAEARHERGERVQVVVKARGLSPNLPHAMHIHGNAGGLAFCPEAERVTISSTTA
ncbi:MAG: hypothetical protein M3P40_04335 [Actinomycetota bacterium]|nr:hypothetical protein [Actinomycetota bacterium]